MDSRRKQEADQAGNTLKIRAELKTLADAPPEVKAHRIKFELVETSDEPGTAMNWPVAAAAARTSRICGSTRPQYRPASNSTTGAEVTTPHGEHDKAEAVISSYDYGAFGTLKVTAEHPYGT